jgi:iron complex outermembrane recepter protein
MLHSRPLFRRIRDSHPARGALTLALFLPSCTAVLLAGSARAEGGNAPPVTTANTAPPARTSVENVQVQGLSRARARRARLQHTAASISDLSAAKLNQLAVSSTRQISNLTPNMFQPRATVGYSNSNYFIRGIGELDPQGEPSVGTYIDGVYIPRTIGTMQELLDIEGIEVDRGPVGFTTGHQAEGGAVRISTVVPDNTTHFTAQAGYGSYNETQAGFAASGALVPDKITASLAVEHHARDGVDHNYTLDRDENDIDYTQARGKLRFTPTERLDITLAFDGTSDGSTNRGYGNLLNPYRYGLYSPVYPKNNYSEAGFTGTVSYALNDRLTLRSITGVRGYDDAGYYDNTGDLYARTSQLLQYSDRAYSEDAQLVGQYGRFSFTAGAYFLYEDWYTGRRANNVFGAQTTNPALIRYQPVDAVIDQVTHNWALYGLAQYKITPSLSASLGLRWNWEQHSNSEALNLLGPGSNGVVTVANDLATLYSAPPGSAPPGALAWTAAARQSWSQLLPKGALEWTVAPRIMPYVSISQGSKSGGFDYRAQTPTALGQQQALLPYNPETVTTYELGVKSEPLRNRLTLNGAFFYNDFQDIQITTLDPSTGLSHRFNAGNGHSLGVEGETTAHILPRWEVDATASYLFAQLDSFDGVFSRSVYANGTAINNTPHSGERLPYAPRFQFDVSTNYVLPVPVPGEMRVAGDISYQTAIFTDALDNDQTRLPDQTFVNALISWRSPTRRWTATLAAKNILDRRYPQSLSYVQGGGVPVYWAAAFNDPRTLFFSLRYAM